MKIEELKTEREEVLWKGKPNKGDFIKERIFSPFLLFALLWLAIDASFIIVFLSAKEFNLEVAFMIPFFALHLAPVYIYIGRVIFALKQWKNIEYMVTDAAIYATHGIFTVNVDRKSFQEVTSVSVHQGIIDKRHNVGDVFIVTGMRTDSNGRVRSIGINIVDIEDFMKVYKLINRTGSDVFADTMYPNDLRPKENHGYKTEYKNQDKE